jgi:hypothetical protein
MGQHRATEELISDAAVLAQRFCCSTELGGDELQTSEDDGGESEEDARTGQ